MEGQSQEIVSAVQSEAPWNISSSDEAFQHELPLPRSERTATIIANAIKGWGFGDWCIEAGFCIKPTKYGAKCISLAHIWNHDCSDSSLSPNGVSDDEWVIGTSCDGPGVPVNSRMFGAAIKSAIALSLEATMQKLEYFPNYGGREKEDEAQDVAMKRQYEESARIGAIVQERRRNRDRNEILQDRLVLHLEIFGEAEY